MTELQNKYYSRHHKAREEGGGQRAWKRNVDNGIQVQLEENEGGSTIQS